MSAFAREHARIIKTVTTDDGKVISLADWQQQATRHRAELDEARNAKKLQEHEARLAALERARPWWSRLLAKVVSVAGKVGR